MEITYHCFYGFLIRLVLIAYGSFQDTVLKVKYTDIDYQVFTDAAEYVLTGKSPFNRHTYRYTPLLSYLLMPNILLHPAIGKVMFGLLDIITSILIFHILRTHDYSLQVCKNCCFMWLYNPIVMVISSRGNAESVMTTLVMLSIYFFFKGKPILCGLIYGLSVHFKIYPCIYSISFYFAYSSYVNEQDGVLKKIIILFTPGHNKFMFVLSSAIGFFIPTIIFILLYGHEYLGEALLYHLFRKDIRHNFSPYFYVFYLSEAMNDQYSAYLSLFVCIIQLSSISVTAWVFHFPKLLPASLFVQTFLFVTLNKVCTSQYFLWYICLFPLVYPMLNLSAKQIIAIFVIWLSSQGLWLLPAYYLEFQGSNTYFWIFIAGLAFYFVNIFFICFFITRIKLSYYLENMKKIK